MMLIGMDRNESHRSSYDKHERREHYANIRLRAGLLSWDGTYMMNVMEPLEFPVVNPWQVQEVVGPGEYLFVRNPYYFKIDTAGNQLPYIDYIRKSTAEGSGGAVTEDSDR